MAMKIKTIDTADAPAWDKYVHSHPRSTLYHLSGWKNIVWKTYQHKIYYMMAVKNGGPIVGILPLIHLKHFIFGNSLVSVPFFDMGGVLADDENTEKTILTEAVSLCKKTESRQYRTAPYRTAFMFGSLGNRLDFTDPLS